MALSINTTITTSEGFEVINPFCFLNIYITQNNWSTLMYYKSEEDWINGRNPLNISQLPVQIQTELTGEEFWGDGLALLIHNKCKDAIEQVTGENTVTIITF